MAVSDPLGQGVPFSLSQQRTWWKPFLKFTSFILKLLQLFVAITLTKAVLRIKNHLIYRTFYSCLIHSCASTDLKLFSSAPSFCPTTKQDKVYGLLLKIKLSLCYSQTQLILKHRKTQLFHCSMSYKIIQYFLNLYWQDFPLCYKEPFQPLPLPYHVDSS